MHKENVINFSVQSQLLTKKEFNKAAACNHIFVHIVISYGNCEYE